MTRILPLLSTALLAFCVVGFDTGCDSATSYDAWDEDDECSTKKSSTSKSRCDDDDADDHGPDGSSSGGELAVDPAIVTLATEQDVVCMTIDVDAAYWVTTDGTISALTTTDVPSTGKPAPSHPLDGLRAPVGDGPCGLVRDGDYLWVTSLQEGAVHRVPVTKKSDRTVSFGQGHITVGGLNAPSSVAVDGDHVFVSEYDSGAIRRFAKPAGPVDGGVVDAGADAGVTPALIASEGTRAGHLLVDDAAVYWLSYKTLDDSNGVRKIAKAGGAVTTLAPADGTALERLGGSLYFFRAGKLRTVSAAGGLSTSIDSNDIAAIATDGSSLYVADRARIKELGNAGDRDLFVYSAGDALAPDGGAKPIALFAQPRRVVWAFGRTISTRSVVR